MDVVVNVISNCDEADNSSLCFTEASATKASVGAYVTYYSLHRLRKLLHCILNCTVYEIVACIYGALLVFHS